VVGCGGDDEGSGGAGGTDPDVQAILDLTGDVTAGSTVYTQTCGISSCHGPSGNDGLATAGDLPTLIPSLSDESIVSTVIKGKGSMPAQGALTDQNVADVLAYVNDRW
jgi:mono/diheme cytochrome c family protein